MTEEEAGKVVKILGEADGGCFHCVCQLLGMFMAEFGYTQEETLLFLGDAHHVTRCIRDGLSTKDLMEDAIEEAFK